MLDDQYLIALGLYTLKNVGKHDVTEAHCLNLGRTIQNAYMRLLNEAERDARDRANGKANSSNKTKQETRH